MNSLWIIKVLAYIFVLETCFPIQLFNLKQLWTGRTNTEKGRGPGVNYPRHREQPCEPWVVLLQTEGLFCKSGGRSGIVPTQPSDPRLTTMIKSYLCAKWYAIAVVGNRSNGPARYDLWNQIRPPDPDRTTLDFTERIGTLCSISEVRDDSVPCQWPARWALRAWWSGTLGRAPHFGPISASNPLFCFNFLFSFLSCFWT
jgi:hypothetical protein